MIYIKETQWLNKEGEVKVADSSSPSELWKWKRGGICDRCVEKGLERRGKDLERLGAFILKEHTHAEFQVSV